MADIISYQRQTAEDVLHLLERAASQVQQSAAGIERVSGRLYTAAGLEISPGSLSLRSVSFQRSYSTVSQGADAYADAARMLSRRTERLLRQARRAFAVLDGCERGLLARLRESAEHLRRLTYQPCVMDAYNHIQPAEYQTAAAYTLMDLCTISYTCDDDPNWKQKVLDMGFADAVYIKDPPGIVAWRITEDGTPQIVIGMMGSRTDFSQGDDRMDWVMNAHILPTDEGIHLGYDALAKRFIRQLKDVKLTGMEGSPRIGQLMERARQGEKVSFLLTGHSKGGAEAQVMTYKMMQQGIPADSISAYTYGSPKPFLDRAGDEGIKAQANVFNHLVSNDPVTKVGVSDPLALGSRPDLFAREPGNIGTDLHLDAVDGKKVFSAHSLNNYKTALDNQRRARHQGSSSGF